jgi:hypothetical protein
MWEGTVVSIHIAPESSAPMQSIKEVRAFPGRGLEADRYFVGTGFYSKKPSYGGREVTLIEIEAVEALFSGVLSASGERAGIKLAAADTRRNIATSGVPLNHLIDRELRRAHARHASLRTVRALGRAHPTWRDERPDPSRGPASPDPGRGRYLHRRCRAPEVRLTLATHGSFRAAQS